MKRREFICVLGSIASGFWSRRRVIIASDGRNGAPADGGQRRRLAVGSLQELVKTRQIENMASCQSKSRYPSGPLRRSVLPRQTATP